MDQAISGWASVAMRAGYVARALFYGLLGFLAAHAAWLGGHAEGAEEALGLLANQTFGTAVLWTMAVGAIGFALWGALAATLDLDRRGRDAMGIFARADYALTAVIYVGLGVLIGQLAWRGYVSGEDGREKSAAWLMSLPAGSWLLLAVGVGFVAAGGWFVWKGFAAKFRERLWCTPTVERLDPFCRFGWMAYGVTVIILGGFLLWAGWTLDASRAGGFAEAFLMVRGLVFGRILLLVLGIGFMAFALECCVEAIYRFIPGPGQAGEPVSAEDCFGAGSPPGALLDPGEARSS